VTKFSSSRGRWEDVDDVTLAASAARTANGAGAAVDVGTATAASLVLAVTASGGTTPTLDVTIQTRHDAGDAWRTVGTFAQKTAAGSERKSFGPLDNEVRASWAIAGTTPTFTFSVAGEAK
jgi:hypothetical protein